MKIAFYRYPADSVWWKVLHHKLVCWWTRGKYSHVEIVLASSKDGYTCASSSARDGGVRIKTIKTMPTTKWDFVEIPMSDDGLARVRAWFERESGKKYDYLAWLGFLFRRVRGSTTKWFCSEAIADCLGYRDAWRFDPNTLFVVLKKGGVMNNKKVGQ